MNLIKTLRLKKSEDRRIKAGHVWIYSNEIDNHATPLKHFSSGEEVIVESHDHTPLGVAFVNPHSLIAARLFSRQPSDRLDLSFFSHRFSVALKTRDLLFEHPYYRLIFAESDALPGLIVDRFKDVLSVQLNTAGMDHKKEIILTALRQILPDTQCILFRNDSPIRQQEGLDQHIECAYGTLPSDILLQENNVSFYAPLEIGQKTGWFYDHRLNRARLKPYVSNKRVLDVFSYLGAFGIQAATWGAREVVAIDVSPLSKNWIERNASLNHVHDKVRVITDDAFDALKILHQSKETFDVIILDPPAFIKKQKDKKEGSIAYQRMNEAALKLLAPDGILMSCSCSMHLDSEELIQLIRKASLKTSVPVQIIERGHQGQDHPVHLAIPETDYLKMVMVKRLEI